MLEMIEDKVAVIPLEATQQSPGGIWIPPEAERKIHQGIIKYVGPKVTEDLAVGDHVLFSPYAGTQVTIEDEGQFYIMRQESIDCKIDETVLGYLLPEGKILALIEDYRLEWLARYGHQPETDSEMQVLDELKHKFETLIQAEGFEF